LSLFGFGKKKAPEPPLDERTKRRISVEHRLLSQSYNLLERDKHIASNPTYSQHVIVLGRTVATMVGNVCFNQLRYGDEPPFYSDVWTRSKDSFDDLAAFLAYWLIIHELDMDDPVRETMTPILLGIAAGVFPASKRGMRLIGRFNELMGDPAELRERRILGLFDGSDDDEARGVVFAYVVNEAVGGPPLELDVNDESNRGLAIDPAYSTWFRLWMLELAVAMIDGFRMAVSHNNDVPLDVFGRAADAAMKRATTSVREVFGQ